MTTARSIPPRHASRRGSAYLLFLGTATIVVLIGLAAVAFTRAEVRRAVQAARLDEARSLAESAVAQAMLLINGTDTWRSRLTNDTWSSEQTLGTGTLSWKLVDETTGDLTADESATVRVYGRGTVGETVYVCSVLVRPPPTLASITTSKGDVIVNGTFVSETTTGWAAATGASIGTSNSREASADGQPHLETTSRTAADAGPRQTLGTPLVQGVTYAFECEARLKSGTDRVQVALWIEATGGSGWVEIANPTVAANWTTITAFVTPTWSGDLVDATLAFGTASSLVDLDIDGVTLTPQPPVVIGTVAGTWRREPN